MTLIRRSAPPCTAVNVAERTMRSGDLGQRPLVTLPALWLGSVAVSQ